MRRVLALPDASVRRRVAGARLDRDGQVHLPHRGREIARNIGCQRLERADVERVQSGGRICSKLHQRRQEAGQRLAPTGGCDQQHAFLGCRGFQERKLVRPWGPAAGREPVRKRGGEGGHG